MKTLEKELSTTIKKIKKSFDSKPGVKEYEKTNRKFKKLVEIGMVKKRGNNLLSPTDAHTKSQVRFNTKR